MKPFGIWMSIVLVVFGIYSAACHIYFVKNPHRVLVAVDTSFPMKADWHNAATIINNIGKQRYTEFCLVTEKKRIHSWSPVLELIKITPYAPRSFIKFTGSKTYGEIEEAEQKYLISNADFTWTEDLKGWTILMVNSSQ